MSIINHDVNKAFKGLMSATRNVILKITQIRSHFFEPFIFHFFQSLLLKVTETWGADYYERVDYCLLLL